jgi:hypothetical protein
MPPRVFSLLLLLFASPLLAQQSAPVIQHAPRRALGPARNQLGNIKVFNSNNWSGYAVIGSGFTQAKGSWIVPAVDCKTAPNASVSFWVGIDGWNDETVEQTGTDSDCNEGKPKYYAWYEFAPLAGVTIPSVSAKPGDSMSAEIDYDGSEFTVTMTNQNTGETYSASSSVPEAQRTSAEWIAELNGIELSNFNAVRFGDDFTQVTGTNSATNASTSGPISAFGNNVQGSVLVAGQDKDEAVPSFLSADGTSFTVTWWAK